MTLKPRLSLSPEQIAATFGRSSAATRRRLETLEADGLMKEQTARLAEDPELRGRYEAAAEDYVSRRDRLEVLEGVPAQGGMPVRVKCLHVLVAHSLAVGEGVNPFGDEALERLPEWWAKGPCVDPDDPDAVPGKRTRSS